MTLPPQISVKKKLSEWLPTDNLELPIEQLILQQVLPEEGVEGFLNPSLKSIHDPSLLKDLDEAVDRILKALELQEQIVVVGDYDVDGITASALLIRFFKYLQHESLHLFIPNRFLHGYGLTKSSVEDIIKLKPDLIITVDNGITAYHEVEVIKQLGADVIITDHHSIIDGLVPECLVINPHQPNCNFPDKNLSGAGVAYFLLIALRRALREKKHWNQSLPEPNLLEDLDLVALGTLADQVPLTGMNRLLSKAGLRVMNTQLKNPEKTSKYSYLRAFSTISRKPMIDSETIAFQLAPLLNAAGRMQDAALGVEFLLTETDHQASKVFAMLVKLNDERKKTGQDMFDKAVDVYSQESLPGIVIYHSDFHEGIIGIVASRMVETYDLPAIIFAQSEKGEWKGSCRSIPGVNILQVLENCSDLLIRYGGHNQAAGCTLEEIKLEPFKSRFVEACKNQLENLPDRVFTADLEVDIRMLSMNLQQTLQVMEPYGQSNPRPLFFLRGIELGYPRVMAEKHFKWDWNADIEFVYWHAPEELFTDAKLDLAFELSENHFRGKKKLQLSIKAAVLSDV